MDDSIYSCSSSGRSITSAGFLIGGLGISVIAIAGIQTNTDAVFWSSVLLLGTLMTGIGATAIIQNRKYAIFLDEESLTVHNHKRTTRIDLKDVRTFKYDYDSQIYQVVYESHQSESTLRLPPGPFSAHVARRFIELLNQTAPWVRIEKG